MKNFWEPRPIKEGFYVFLFSPMTDDICLKGFWPPEAKVAVDLGTANPPFF
jgi:hypothetical protein